MKFIYILIPALLLSFIHSRAESGDNVTGITITGGIFPHFSSQSGNNSANNSRLVAKVHSSYYQNRLVPIDSVHYIYKGERGGTTLKDEPNNDENIYFDESFSYIYNRTSGIYENDLWRIQNFTANKVTSLVYKNWRPSPGEWRDSARYTYNYLGGVMTKTYYEIWIGSWKQHVLSELVYDANNNVTQMNSNGYVAKFTYDVDNNLIGIVDSQQNHDGTWALNEKKSYAYNSEGEVTVYILEKWDMAVGEVKKTRFEYTYLAKNVATTIESEWKNGTWNNVAKHLFTYDTDDNKTEDIRQTWDAGSATFVNAQKEEWTYNEHRQPVRILEYSWINASWQHTEGDEELKFYYEYFFPAGIDNVATDENDIIVYPTNAAENINIRVDWDRPQSCTVLVYDMNGRIVYRGRQVKAGDFDMNISLGALASGNYIVKVVGETSHLTSKFAVAH